MAWYRDLATRLGESINGRCGRPSYPGTSGGTVLAVFEHQEMNSVAVKSGSSWMLHNEVPGVMPAVGDYVEIKWTRDMECLGAEVRPHPQQQQQVKVKSRGMGLG